MHQLSSLRLKPSLREQIGNKIREELMLGNIQCGSYLTESSVAETFDVSRTPAREAMNSLCDRGHLVALPRGGFVVVTPTASDIEDIMEVRRLIEPCIMTKVATLATQSEIATIDSYLQQLDDLVDKQSVIFQKLIVETREFLLSLCHNRYLVKTIQGIDDQTLVLRSQCFADATTRRTIFNGLADIIVAIKSRDERAILTATEAHLDNAYQTYISIIRPQMAN